MKSVIIIVYRYTNQVSTGDEVLVECSSKLVPAKVTSISNLMMKG